MINWAVCFMCASDRVVDCCEKCGKWVCKEHLDVLEEECVVKNKRRANYGI